MLFLNILENKYPYKEMMIYLAQNTILDRCETQDQLCNSINKGNHPPRDVVLKVELKERLYGLAWALWKAKKSPSSFIFPCD